METQVHTIERDIASTLRTMVRDQKAMLRHAKQNGLWAEAAASQAYINGLEQAQEVVRIVIGRYDANR